MTIEITMHDVVRVVARQGHFDAGEPHEAFDTLDLVFTNDRGEDLLVRSFLQTVGSAEIEISEGIKITGPVSKAA